MSGVEGAEREDHDECEAGVEEVSGDRLPELQKHQPLRARRITKETGNQ